MAKKQFITQNSGIQDVPKKFLKVSINFFIALVSYLLAYFFTLECVQENKKTEICRVRREMNSAVQPPLASSL